MELALVGDHAAREQQVRLKLHFEDATILSAQQIQEGLCNSWFLLGRNLHSIADLASHIVIAFSLRSSCPHGISVRMENFTLPPSQSVGLLKDKDIVSVNRNRIPLSAVHQEGEPAFSSSFDTLDKITSRGVKTHAIEEFERETGGYESEEEEEKDTRENLLKDGDNKAVKQSLTKSQKRRRKREKVEKKSVRSSATQVNHADSSSFDTFGISAPFRINSNMNAVKDLNDTSLKASTTKPKGKKRKLDKGERIQEQGLEVVPYIGGVGNNKKKKHKKRRLADQQVESEKLQCTSERQKCQISREGQKSECSKAARVKEKKQDKAISNKGDDSMKDRTVEKQGKVSGSKKETFLAMSDSSSDEEVKDKVMTPGPCKEGGVEKKCSRSTLRKRAKRQWKRANSGVTTKMNKLEDDPAKVDKAGTEQVGFSISSKQEDDGDAEEERLPRVVRPGHVRFQASDEDIDGNLDPRQHPLPHLGWSNGISKRKGQNWGQEKTKRGNSCLQATGAMEIDDIQELNFETLPAVEGMPENGDVIAYRILELTSSFCPELSEYRVGKVLNLENESGKVKLVDVPKYSTATYDDNDPPSNEDGVRETQISSLAEVRLVERSKVVSPRQVSIEMPARQDEGTHMDMGADTMMHTDKTCYDHLNILEADTQIEKTNAASLQGWPEISDALHKKREELASQVEGRMLGNAEHRNNEKIEIINPAESQNLKLTTPTSITELQNGKEPEYKEDTTSSRVAKIESGGGKTTSNGTSAHRGPRGWQRKAGGLGSTMSLLRSQNVV